MNGNFSVPAAVPVPKAGFGPGAERDVLTALARHFEAAGITVPDSVLATAASDVTDTLESRVASRARRAAHTYRNAVERRDLELVQRVQAGIAYSIEAELICCDVYDRRDTATSSEIRSHAICYWGEAARGLVMSYDPLNDYGMNRSDLHAITGGALVCSGDEFDPCHRYPGCACESWEESNLNHCDEETGALLPGHGSRTHDWCLIEQHFGGGDLGAMYLFDSAWSKADHEFPDGPVVVSWDGDGHRFRYVSDPADAAHLPTDHWSSTED